VLPGERDGGGIGRPDHDGLGAAAEHDGAHGGEVHPAWPAVSRGREPPQVGGVLRERGVAYPALDDFQPVDEACDPGGALGEAGRDHRRGSPMILAGSSMMTVLTFWFWKVLVSGSLISPRPGSAVGRWFGAFGPGGRTLR